MNAAKKTAGWLENHPTKKETDRRLRVLESKMHLLRALRESQRLLGSAK